MIDFNNNIYLGVASPDMERDLSNYYTKAQTRALVDTKQDIITGAATTITEDNLTANRAVISNASGKVAVSNVTSTELGYLSGVTSGVQTQLNNKASTSLDNLSAAGQMIIDSQNGTISNCILEIQQNIKLEFSNGTVTLKAGSTIVRSGSTYQTLTTTQDTSWATTTLSNTKAALFVSNLGHAQALYGRCSLNSIGSGSSLPANGDTYKLFFNVTDKLLYHWDNDDWVATTHAYPLAVIEVGSQGVITGFAKDSNGNDMIFNGAGFIGHHAFIYPNVKALIPDGFNEDGSLKSVEINNNALRIVEMTTTTPAAGYEKILHLGSTGIYNANNYKEVESYNDLGTQNYSIQYVKKDNIIYYYNSATYETRIIAKILSYAYDGTTVTNFTIRQPYQGARNLLTDDLYKQIGDVETLLAAI